MVIWFTAELWTRKLLLQLEEFHFIICNCSRNYTLYPNLCLCVCVAEAVVADVLELATGVTTTVAGICYLVATWQNVQNPRKKCNLSCNLCMCKKEQNGRWIICWKSRVRAFLGVWAWGNRRRYLFWWREIVVSHVGPLPSFLPSFEQPKWQRFLANIRHRALRQKSELNPDRIFVRRDRNQAAVLLFCMLQQENQHPRQICFQVVFFCFLFFCFCCKLHLVCFQERTQLTFSCVQERSGAQHNSDGNRKFFGFLGNLSSSSSS